jgi:hypothetical protein
MRIRGRLALPVVAVLRTAAPVGTSCDAAFDLFEFRPGHRLKNHLEIHYFLL